MFRRSGLFIVGVSLAVAFAVPAAAEAAWLVVLPKKPAKIHVIAVRRGHRIIWKDRTRGLAKKRLHLRKTNSVSAYWLSAHTATALPAPQTFSGTCPPTGSKTLPLDGTSLYQPYSGSTATLYSDVLTCSGGGWSPPQTAYGPVPLVSGQPGCAFPAENQTTEMPISGGFVNAEYVWFVDGEWGVICTVPDDNGAGVSNAGSDALKVYQQGFKCQVPAATPGPNNTVVPVNLRNTDSIELYQSLGSGVYSVTTTCIGKLPASVTPPKADSTHTLGCLEPNPFPGGASIKGYGATVTYADGQYSETCSVPNYGAA